MKRFLPLLLTALILLTACAQNEQVVQSFEGFYFDTYISIRVYDPGVPLPDGLKELCEEAEKTCSATDPDSELYRFNRGQIDEENLSPLLSQALADAEQYRLLSGGAADPAIGNVSSLWDWHADPPHVPDSDSIHAALLAMKSAPEYDLGYIAKGEISKRIAEHLKECGIRSALINLGGNVVALGEKPDGSPFTVGIQDPDEPSALLTTVDVTDKAVVTSGSYERCFTVDGTLYHHILDPETGYPVNNGLCSVTIISSDPIAADALSTACFVMGKEKGLALIESLDDAEALFVSDDGKQIRSSGFPQP
ncbi:MAG: FAD:protein FMN transferase [Lachnospiraceae bacterium]|nr:FAD:protein FMN transferase [Lachnospiraceae bacterium]